MTPIIKPLPARRALPNQHCSSRREVRPVSWRDTFSKLAHHPDKIETLRTPTVERPWRVLVSGCLHGLPCGVDGTDYGMRDSPHGLTTNGTCFAFCPEDDGLGTPRTMPDLHGGDGVAVLKGHADLRREPSRPDS